MFITKLNGEILYYSPLHVGAHDQAHWNELGLRNLFVGKSYGILADGGFTLNRKGDAVLIQGYKPHQKPKGGSLMPEQKIYNKN